MLRGMWVNTSEFAGKDNDEIVSCRYSFLTFLCNFEFLLGLLYFPREVFDVMYEDLLYNINEKNSNVKVTTRTFPENLNFKF